MKYLTERRRTEKKKEEEKKEKEKKKKKNEISFQAIAHPLFLDR